MSASEIFNDPEQKEAIRREAKNRMTKIVYHRLKEVKKMYKDTLDITFPEYGEVEKSIDNRHDLVHRNGKTTDDKEVLIDKEIVDRNLDTIEAFVCQIDKQLEQIEL